ncbi:hypothetical protein ANACOL_03780 [Anaerotruncus colihominis DSM 17241]|uniref:Uncharacterized protein n=1 Tax=Anaerotruncus colihominis DSM 17241 TaxID=445972 RepID=B0PG48_9FIRM|nr:hypothetical protein ANACOL_03780 [Anaerotruncus colihominis DSM 17241]
MYAVKILDNSTIADTIIAYTMIASATICGRCRKEGVFYDPPDFILYGTV